MTHRVLFLDEFHHSALNEVERDLEPPSKRKLDALFRTLSERAQQRVLKKLSDRKRRPRRTLSVPYAAEFSTSCGRSRVPSQIEVPESKPTTVTAAPRCPHGCLCRPGETTSLICAACRMGWPAWDDTRKLSKDAVVCHTPIKDAEDLEEKDVLTNTEVRRLEQSPDDEDAFSRADEELVDEEVKENE